jgi:integral membrane protein (TIGR01906 family)
VHIARSLAAALFIFAIPVFLLLSNVRIAAMEPRVYGYSFSEYDVSDVTGLARPQLDGAARDIVRYFRDDRALLTTRVEVNGEEQALFTAREALHMRDVKALFRYVFVLHELAFVYIAGYIAAVFLWAQERSLLRLASYLISAGVLTAGMLAVAAAASFVGFDALFTRFHMISFANDLWLLDPTRDRLIQMFPRDFWFTVTLAVGVTAVMQGLLLALLGYGLRTWLDRPGTAPALDIAARVRS